MKRQSKKPEKVSSAEEGEECQAPLIENLAEKTVPDILSGDGNKGANAMRTVDLHGYARMNSIDDLQTAIMNGADVNGKDRFGATPLHYAIAEKRLEVISVLLKHGADVTAQDVDGRTPLHYAVENNLPKVAEELLKKNRAVISIGDKFGNQPLWTAAFNSKGNYDFVALLLHYGADPKHQNNANLTPLDIPKRKRDDALLSVLESK